MDDPEHYQEAGGFSVQKKVHSLALDQETHRLYAPEQKRTGKQWREWWCTNLW